MARRITAKDLESQVRIINTLTNNPQEPYTSNMEGYKPNDGAYYLDSAYGGVQLVQMVVSSAGSGEKDILPRGYHCTKRELYQRLEGFIAGLEVAERTVNK